MPLAAHGLPRWPLGYLAAYALWRGNILEVELYNRGALLPGLGASDCAFGFNQALVHYNTFGALRGRPVGIRGLAGMSMVPYELHQGSVAYGLGKLGR